MSRVTLRRLKTRELGPGSRFLYVGASGLGKSTLMASILRTMTRTGRGDVGFVWSASAVGGMHQHADITKHFPLAYVSDASTGVNWKRVAVCLKKVRELSVRRKLAFHFIFEDVGYDKSIRTAKPFNYLMTVGRHYACTHISLHGATILSPMQRENADYIFICNDTRKARRKQIHEQLVGDLTFAQFSALMNALKNHQALVYMPTKKIKKHWIERFAFYEVRDYAKVCGNWRFGKKEYWNAHSKHYDAEWLGKQIDKML